MASSNKTTLYSKKCRGTLSKAVPLSPPVEWVAEKFFPPPSSYLFIFFNSNQSESHWWNQCQGLWRISSEVASWGLRICAPWQIRQLGGSRRDVRLFHESLELESTTEVLNGPAARTNWFTAGWGGVGFWLLVSVFLHLLIAYWWNSYGSKLTSQHSISSLTRLSQPGVWYAVRGACLRTVTLKCLTHGQGRLPPGAPRRSPPKNICTSV